MRLGLSRTAVCYGTFVACISFRSREPGRFLSSTAVAKQNCPILNCQSHCTVEELRHRDAFAEVTQTLPPNQCTVYSAPVPWTQYPNIEVGVGSSVLWVEGVNDSTIQPRSPSPGLLLCVFPGCSHHRGTMASVRVPCSPMLRPAPSSEMLLRGNEPNWKPPTHTRSALALQSGPHGHTCLLTAT